MLSGSLSRTVDTVVAPVDTRAHKHGAGNARSCSRDAMEATYAAHFCCVRWVGILRREDFRVGCVFVCTTSIRSMYDGYRGGAIHRAASSSTNRTRMATRLSNTIVHAPITHKTNTWPHTESQSSRPSHCSSSAPSLPPSQPDTPPSTPHSQPHPSAPSNPQPRTPAVPHSPRPVPRCRPRRTRTAVAPRRTGPRSARRRR